MRAAGVALLLGLAGAVCRPEGPSDGECERLCGFALRCGFLPSSLGGAYGDPEEVELAQCRERCANTEDAALVEALAGCFTQAQAVDACDLRPCTAAIACVKQSEIIPNEVLGRTDVTLRTLDGVFWSVVFRHAVCEDASPAIQADYGLDDYCAGRGPVDGYACAGAADQPSLCEPVDCKTPDVCDPSMCQEPFIGALADCDYYGIEEVQFGYRDPTGVLQLASAVHSCEEASRGVRLAELPPGLIQPIALFRGRLSARVAVDLGRSEAVGRRFCWASWPLDPRRLTRSGEATLVVPTPSTAQLIDRVYERDREFPVGCGCAFETIDCEETAEDCVNGVDDDEDGLVDAEDFGCLPAGERECSNGVDDDADGLVDADEPECAP